MRPFSTNVERSFTNHGVEIDASYTYVLLVDFSGQALIKRVKSDNTEIRFALKADGTDVDTFWANRASEEYKYIFEFKNE